MDVKINHSFNDVTGKDSSFESLNDLKDSIVSSEILSSLTSGQLARLIPVGADSKKEERATSILLASFMVVPALALQILSQAGVSVGKKSKIQCYTEITFKTHEKEKKPRPDGLIVIRKGAKVWTALIESKIGNAELSSEQIEEYLVLARTHKINAVITVSNQFATLPTHHPVRIPKAKTRSVDLYHFSWLSLKSKALLLICEKKIDDPEQAYILSELVRYLDHEASGVTSFRKMPSTWKDLCLSVQNGTQLNRNSDTVIESVSGWHQLLRQLALDLTMAIEKPVEISLSRAKGKNAAANLVGDCLTLSTEMNLKAEFFIMNAASKIKLIADISRKVITVSMKLSAPKDRKRATASINWLTRQFKGKNVDELSLKAHWPGRTPHTIETIENLRKRPAALIPASSTALPTHLEVIRVVDLGARFKGAKTFVDEVSSIFPAFYHDAGQYLNKWIAKAPKMEDKESKESSSSVSKLLPNSSECIDCEM